MKLAIAWAVLLSAASARAETALDEYGPSGPARPATTIAEAQCEIAVQLAGGVVTVEQRQRLVYAGGARGPTGAIYRFDLPPSAALTSFAVKTEGGTIQALPIAGEHTTVGVARRPMLGADPALLVARPSGAASQYAIYAQPWSGELELITRYTALAEVAAGALRFTLPARASQPALSACRGTLRAQAGPGATIARIVVDGASQSARPAPFVLGAAPVVLEAQLAFAGAQPVVWTQSEPIGDGFTASVVTVAAPSLRTQTPLHRRALLVIDASRSMELVGRRNVGKVVRAVTAALPPAIEVDAILYDRTARRVFDAWKPLSADTAPAIEAALAARPAVNGSDLPGALRTAHTAIADGAAASTLVVVIGDGVIGDTAGGDLTAALDAKTSTVDVLAVVLDPARTSSPGAAALRAPVALLGGSFVEVASDELDTALAAVDEWLRPAWSEVALADLPTPGALPSGSGFVQAVLERRAPSALVLTAKGARSIRVPPRPGPKAAVAALVLATTDDRDEAERTARARARARTPFAAPGLAFAALTTTGAVARDRTAMVRKGGPYERIVALADPDDHALAAAAPAPTPSAIARDTLERLFRDQLQPKAYACYQRALGAAPTLAGTVQFTLHLGRGEVSQVQLAGLGNAQLDACLLDAAYALAIPLPDFTVNADDATLVHYPLSFALGKDAPIVVLGDADSSSPLDIDGIPGGVPVRGKKIEVDAKTPLGTMRPSH